MSNLAGIENLPLADARAKAVEIVSKLKSAKKDKLLRDVQKAPTSAEVSRILWMMELAKSGLSSLDSSWSK